MIAFWKSVLFVALIGIASFYIGEALPRKWFHPERFPFRAWKWEKEGKIYDKIRIKEWKDHVPDMSKIVKRMVPKRLGNCPKSADVMILAQETCRAESVHFALCVCGLALYTFWWNWVGVVVVVLDISCNVPFIFIQRYNRPALIALAKRLKVREDRKAAKAAQAVQAQKENES